MSRSNDSIINEILNKYDHLISDMGVLSQVPRGSIRRNGFAKYSRFFCDSIIFWGIHNYDDKGGQGIAVGKYVGAIRETFKKTSLEMDSPPKWVGSGLIHSNTEYFGSALLKANREEYTEEMYRAGYIAVKVSLKDPRAKDLIPILDSMLPTLKKHGVVLHDIDLAKDCRYITTRSHIKIFLEKKGITTIKKDRSKVGDHCISWMGHTKNTKNIRYKVYNKFVQIMESAEVRKTLGSRMEEFVVGDSKFTERLIKHKDHGFSRLELTFYGPKLLSYEKYHNRIDKAMELLEECPTFKCSFENQWRQRADRIKSMIAIYLPEKEKGVFAYCHWRNSVTSKKYGYVWKKVLPDVVPKLLANYSFNDRPIYYFEAKVDEKDKVSITKEEVYAREPGCTAITLVPGGSKGMFPSRDSFPELARKFSEMGFVEVDNISIGWPKKRFNKNSAPLAEIVEGWNENEDEGYTKRLKNVNLSVYRSDFKALALGTKYTIIAAGLQYYRRRFRWHFITECGIHIRAGKSLHKLWDDWRYNFHVNGRTDVENTEWMTFLAVNTTISKGIGDMKCKLA